jgi:hypothetical protein
MAACGGGSSWRSFSRVSWRTTSGTTPCGVGTVCLRVATVVRGISLRWRGGGLASRVRVRVAGVIVLAIAGTGHAEPAPRARSVPLFSLPAAPSSWAGPGFVDWRRSASQMAAMDAVIQTPYWILINFVGTSLLGLADTPSTAEQARIETMKHARVARPDPDLVRRALYHLPGLLAATWRNEAWAPGERRRILFEIWDSCAEDSAGDFARATIIAFIRRELPEGSPHAYSREVLAQLNLVRTSRARFEPYGAP